MTDANSGIGGIVLAGGRSLRLGRDKALETIGSRTLLGETLHRASFLTTNTILVVATAQAAASPHYLEYPVAGIISDLNPGKGPLGGIYTGLRSSPFRHNLVIGCDMPFLNRALLSYMAGLASGFDIVIPRLGKFVEPLHAIYSTDCLAVISSLLERDRLQVGKLLLLVRTRYVEADEIDLFDIEHLSFFNVNTAPDLARARQIMSQDSCLESRRRSPAIV